MCCESCAKNALQVAAHPGQSDGDRNDKREHDRGGKNNERNWVIPASRRTSSPGITCVSSGLTGGTGSGFIDGELGMW